MKTKFVILSFAIAFILSCSKEDEKSINTDLLLKYKYVIANIPEIENNHNVYNDTVTYTFLSADSVIATRLYYTETSEGVTEYIESKTSRRSFSISNNRIGFVIPNGIYTNIELLFENSWEVTEQNSSYMTINLWNQGNKVGENIQLLCKEK